MNAVRTVAHLIIPQHSNNHKAKMLHSSALLLATFAILLYQTFLQFFPLTKTSILGYAANIPAEEIVRLTNIKRQEAGLDPLQFNNSLATAAKAKGEHMLSQDYWAHVAPDGTEPWKFFGDVGYKYRYAGENLARDFSNANSAIDAWLASPTHRENMMSPKYKEIGVAVIEGDLAGVDTTLIVQLFGTTLVDTTPAVPIAQAKQVNIAPTTAPEVTAVPTQSLSPTPSEETFVAAVSPIPSQSQVLTAGEPVQDTSRQKVLISPFNTTRGISLVVIISLMGVAMVDWVVVSHRKIPRIGGRSFAHIGFLGMVLAVLLLAKAGQIL